MGAALASLSRPLAVRRRAVLMRHPRLTLAAVLLGTLLGLALFAPWVTSYDPLALAVTQRLRPPSALHWFGTDAMDGIRSAAPSTAAGSRC